MKDPKQFRERFKKWKEGTPIEEIYDNGRPTEYIEYMKRLAQPMAKNWEISEKEAYVHLLNDDSYDYYGWWKDGGKNIDPKTMEAAKPPLLPNDDGHFPDTYKTAKHPTFSNQSKYSGVVHPKYNPLGIHGGAWLGDTYLKGPMYLPGYSGGKDDRTYIGGSNLELVVTPGKSWVNPYTGEYTRATESYAQPIASKDPYVDYQFYSPTGNSIVQTINSTPRWQQYWADQEGARVAEAKKKAAPYILNLLTAIDAVATGPEMLEGLYGLYNLTKGGISKIINKVNPPKIANGYSLSIEDALKDIDFDFEVTGAPRTWWDIMLKKRPEIAIERWNKLGLDKNSNPIISDRTSLDAAKNIFNADWYKSRLSEISNSTDDIVNQFNRNIDNTAMFARDPGSELGLTADGRTISRLHFGIGIDGNPTTILKNNIFIHPDALTRSGRFLHHSDKMVNEIIKHEGLHASSGVGLLMPKEIKVNNTLYHMTPKQNIKDESIRKYMDIDDEQRVRLLKFADIAERKFNGNYEKAYDYLADNYYTWAINDVPHDVMELLYYFDKPEVINAGKHILGFAAPITAVSALSNQYKHGKDSGIYIKPSKRGTFTAAAKKRGMSVLSFASKVLNNPSNYSKAMRKKALFAKNASKFKH